MRSFWYSDFMKWYYVKENGIKYGKYFIPLCEMDILYGMRDDVWCIGFGI